MREITPEGAYQMELATARVEAIMAVSEAAMMILLDGPDRRNAHVAMAVKLILDDQVPALERRMEMLEAAVLEHHPTPETREVPESQPKFADRVTTLTERYERHMASHFPRKMKNTADSVYYTLTLMPVVINRAMNHLNAEVITRDEEDPTRRGYLEAMLELSRIIPVEKQEKALELSRKLGDERGDRKRRHMDQAYEAARNTRQAGPPAPERGMRQEWTSQPLPS